MDKENSFIRKISNFKVLVGYILESLNVIKQGYTIRDKIILILYFLKIPIFLVKSLLTGKLLREIEEEDKFLIGNVILNNKYGKYYCGNNILTVYIADENYEKHLYPYLELKDGLFIDVGAHIGKYTIKLGKTGSNKVIAIEPEKSNYNFLEKNVQLNNLDNVTIINKGVYSSFGEIPFYIAGKGEGDHSVLKRSDEWEEATIEVDTLDNLIDALNIDSKIGLIKFDIEGAEVHAIKGAQKIIQKHHPKLLIEILKENNTNFLEIKKVLEGYNYNEIIPLDEDNYLFT